MITPMCITYHQYSARKQGRGGIKAQDRIQTVRISPGMYIVSCRREPRVGALRQDRWGHHEQAAMLLKPHHTMMLFLRTPKTDHTVLLA